MDPILVDELPLYPRICVDGRQDGPLFDTCMDAPGTSNCRVYLSRQHVRDLARVGLDAELPELVEAAIGYAEGLGYLEPDQASDLQRRVTELEGEVAELLPVRDAIAKFGVSADDEPVGAGRRHR